MENVVVQLKFHAYMQYLERVGPIQMDELESRVQELVAAGTSVVRKKFIVIDDVWWIYHRQRNCLTLVTCYGRTSGDLIRGLSWAYRHNDSLDLKNMVWVEGGEVSCRETNANSEAEEVCRRIPD